MKSIIPENKRDRTVIRQEMFGKYSVSQAFFDEHERDSGSHKVQHNRMIG